MKNQTKKEGAKTSPVIGKRLYLKADICSAFGLLYGSTASNPDPFVCHTDALKREYFKHYPGGVDTDHQEILSHSGTFVLEDEGFGWFVIKDVY